MSIHFQHWRLNLPPTFNVVDGRGGPRSDVRHAAVSTIVAAQVALETMANELHVNGGGATAHETVNEVSRTGTLTGGGSNQAPSISGSPTGSVVAGSSYSFTPGETNIGTYQNIVISVSDGQLSASPAPFAITVNAVSLGSVTILQHEPLVCQSPDIGSAIATNRQVIGSQHMLSKARRSRVGLQVRCEREILIG